MNPIMYCMKAQENTLNGNFLEMRNLQKKLFYSTLIELMNHKSHQNHPRSVSFVFP